MQEVSFKRRNLISGWGINDLPYIVKPGDGTDGKRLPACPFYERWVDVIKRCKSPRVKSLSPCYQAANISEEWKYASDFRAWMDSQVWLEPGREHKLHLDKDILVPGNKLYSPTTCAFVPRELNCVLIVIDNKLNIPGVGQRAGKEIYYSTVTTRNIKKHLGDFKTPLLAHKAWQLAKIDRLQFELEEYRNLQCYRQDVDAAMKLKIDNIWNDYKSDNITFKI